ncbi:ImmA/IrrE family metallo-endopeptidase [Leuconostoc falkenbergense]|uniref:ImmA/IrrE family metallo-endopeptidase n=1 Tax=Leuconostoc falkenbergense TaxID=2766470 RepID=UPI00293C9CC4|nr:ImmA/IrrE family metallo-endopeptidase [Leuconostoc falkenbergense]MDV3544905.1 ImmA/IrrE family metallo-endopeptidase [Leuconostoc falkenbergense]
MNEDILTTENIENTLLDIAKRNFVDVYFLNMKSSTPDVAIPRDDTVVMNPNFTTKVSLMYRFSHELSHVLYGDPDAQAVYYFSEYGKRGEERLAHRNAIRMLMSIEMPTSVNTFMEYYHVPSWLEKDVDRTFRELAYLE